MKKYLYLIFLPVFMGCVTTPISEEARQSTMSKLDVKLQHKEKLYTAYNIWYDDTSGNGMDDKYYEVMAINYKEGLILPAGTEVKNVKVQEHLKDYIKFNTATRKKTFQVWFSPRWHTGKSVYDYGNYMFTTKNFEELTAGMTEDEIDAIKNGFVRPGMSKEKVIIAYGYPPEHQTRSLEARSWKYWMDEEVKKRICFDRFDKAMACL